jgi:hypothetical protein
MEKNQRNALEQNLKGVVDFLESKGIGAVIATRIDSEKYLYVMSTFDMGPDDCLDSMFHAMILKSGESENSKESKKLQ